MTSAASSSRVPMAALGIDASEDSFPSLSVQERLSHAAYLEAMIDSLTVHGETAKFVEWTKSPDAHLTNAQKKEKAEKNKQKKEQKFKSNLKQPTVFGVAKPAPVIKEKKAKSVPKKQADLATGQPTLFGLPTPTVKVVGKKRKSTKADGKVSKKSRTS